MRHTIIYIIIIAMLAVSAVGCVGQEMTEPTASEPTVVAVAPTEVPIATPMATPEPTPVVTTTPVPTPTPTVAPTPSPTPERVGLVTLTEGFYYYELDDELIERITGLSYPIEGSDIIGYDDLRYIKILHYDFDGAIHEGELMANVRVADELLEIFFALYEAKYPLTSVKLVGDFGEPFDDGLSMAANNTSMFCYRFVTGTKKLSRHGYGGAIDINPRLNPYIDGDRIVPENGIQYADRSLGEPGMIDHDDLCYQLFIEHGWTWGGDWSGDKDYQHFSKDLGYR
ncbi:MAG: M15 family metallopeptidase [Clostridia bacterium]|nr:M15 family metallopeptidase [Clostridia bacterium]